MGRQESVKVVKCEGGEAGKCQWLRQDSLTSTIGSQPASQGITYYNMTLLFMSLHLPARIINLEGSLSRCFIAG
jgi:hypothetical protein